MSLRTLQLDCYDYSTSTHAPILHRKKMFLAEDYPGYEMFAELTDAERQELLALVELAEEKTLEKLRAQAALRRIGQVFPKLAESA